MAVSISQVAHLARVSNATVSKVLNEAPGARVSDETRRRVREAAQELGYFPNALARAMRHNRMDTIGVILPPSIVSTNDVDSDDAILPLNDSFLGKFLNNLFLEAIEVGKNVTICTGYVWQNALGSLSRFRDGRCDGFLILYQPNDSDIVPTLLDANVPIVLITDEYPDTRSSSVDIDNFDVGYKATSHLLSLGHRKLSYLCHDIDARFMLRRWDGIRKALAEHGLALDQASIISADWTSNAVYTAMDRIADLKPSERPTALISAESDAVAADAIAGLMRRSIRVPEDVSVIGVNDDDIARRTTPALTTIRLPYRLIAKNAINQLSTQIENINSRGIKETLPIELVIRGSTARIAIEKS